MKSAYQIIQRPVITSKKAWTSRENQNTLVFQVAKAATKTEIKGSGAADFQGEGALGSQRRTIRAKGTPAR